MLGHYATTAVSKDETPLMPPVSYAELLNLQETFTEGNAVCDCFVGYSANLLVMLNMTKHPALKNQTR